MVGLLLPAVQAAREAARRMSCGNNFKQLGLGLHNYHAAYNKLPMQMGGTKDCGTVNDNNFKLSFLVGVLPFIEQQALWEQISNPNNNGGTGRPWGHILIKLGTSHGGLRLLRSVARATQRLQLLASSA